MKNICVICDKEKEYACRLMEYMNMSRMLPFETVACTSKESLLSYARKNPIDILLVAEGTMEEEIGTIPAVYTIVLNEGLGTKAAGSYRQVCKYQAGDSLVREVMDAFSASRHAGVEFGTMEGKNREIIGVFSPGETSLRLAFALALAHSRSAEKKVLLAEIDRFSGLNEIYDLSSERGLGDLLYYREQGSTQLMAKLSGMVYERCGFDIIPSPASPEDLFEVPAVSWLSLFREIAEKSMYDVLILDIGIPSYELLDFCGTVWMPEYADELSSLKEEEFMKALSASRYREAEQKIRTVLLPDTPAIRSRKFYDSPGNGYFGNYVNKTVLTDEGEVWDRNYSVMKNQEVFC